MGALVVVPLAVCEDCGSEVEEGVEPIGLFREVADAPADQVWDATKQKMVRRRRQNGFRVARRGGRRWREHLLCRRCRGLALKARASNGTVMENGRRRALKTRERLAPKKGGRPRLLDDVELRAAYRLYLNSTLSRRQIAIRLAAARGGSRGGYESALLYGGRRLELPLVRTGGVGAAMTRWGSDGTKSKPQNRRCEADVKHGERKGKRCNEYAMKGKRFCVNHREVAAA